MKNIFTLLLLQFTCFAFSQDKKVSEVNAVLEKPTVTTIITNMYPDGLIEIKNEITKAEFFSSNTVVTKMEFLPKDKLEVLKQKVYKVGDVVNNTVVTTMIKADE